MPAIPFPFLTFSLVLILLLKIVFTRPSGYRGAAIFIGGCAVLLLVCALRWELDARVLRQLQSLIAIAIPPLAWRCFVDLTGQSKRQKLTAFVLPPTTVLLLNLVAPAATDLLLMLLFVGYGCALIGTSRLGADAFIFTRLSDARSISLMAFFAGGFLCFSGLTDLAIAIDFRFYQGHHAPFLVALSQAILLPFIGLAIVYSGAKTPRESTADVPQTRETDSSNEVLSALCQHVETLVSEQQLFLNPDLTLNSLARKAGIPARQISRAVNQTRGCNVSQWVNGFRVSYAQQRLVNSDTPVTQIMLDSGFATKSNFNKEFARLSGMSPTDYRHEAAGKLMPDSQTR